MGKDTHGLSGPAQRTALEVLAANGVQHRHPAGRRGDAHACHLTSHPGATTAGARRISRTVIVVTPSHNPPEDGGIKYNPPNGGPADTDVTKWMQDRANALLREGNAGVKRVPFEKAFKAATTRQEDFILPYVQDLRNVIDMEIIREAGLVLGVDPLGGAAVHYWEPINRVYKLNIAVVNPKVDPTFSFMTVDHDGKIRMDCSSPYAMASLVGLKDRYRVAFANDPDSDRHGIVTPSAGLMNPNHYLAVAIRYLLTHRPQWPTDALVGKTPGVERHDRSCRRQARPPALRSTGRLQVVCSGPVRRLVLLRRRGERRSELLAARRDRLDDRQGRSDHEPARSRDHGPNRQRSGEHYRELTD